MLLVYANPAVTASPVPPYGMERIAQVMGMAGCDVTMLAPFVEADPLAALDAALADEPALVGFSVRNIDDALVVRSEVGPGEVDTTFLLDEVVPLVRRALEVVGPKRVVLGGAALSSGALPVLRYLGAELAVRGPAEDLVFGLGRQLALGREPRLPDEDPRVVRADDASPRAHASPAAPRGFARTWRPPPGPTPRMGPYLGLVVARGGRVPVQIAAGCDRRCHFCVEPRFTGHVVVPREVEAIVNELAALRAHGIRRFWLTASELNVPHDRRAVALFRAIAKRFPRGDLDLQVFLQVAPVSDELLDALEDAGVDPSGLSFELGHLDERVLRAGGGPANLAQIEALVETWLRRGYRQLGGSVLFGAHPLEDEDTLATAFARALAFDRALPDGFGLAYACGARVYPETPLADWVASHWEEAAPHVYGAADPSFVRPVVFCRPLRPRSLLARVKAALASARGPMGPMNAEAPADPRRLAAEAWVNRGIWRLQEDRPREAVACFEAALRHEPEHLEALAQLAMVRGNELGDSEGARRALSRLLAALPAGDPRRDEVLDALARSAR